MLLDGVVLLGVSGAGLAQNLVGDANLADVVQQRAKPQHFECRPRLRFERTADGDRQHADAI